jgi:hypothetical protein
MSTKYYLIRVEVPVHHEVWPKVLAFLGWLKRQGIDSEVSMVTVSTPPAPWSCFIADEVVTALGVLGSSKIGEIALHLGWEKKRVMSHLGHLLRRGVVVHAGKCYWALAGASDGAVGAKLNKNVLSA